jgi:hypothetical protein
MINLADLGADSGSPRPWWVAPSMFASTAMMSPLRRGVLPSTT